MCRAAASYSSYYYYQPVHLGGYKSFEEIKRTQTERDYQKQDDIKSVFFLKISEKVLTHIIITVYCVMQGIKDSFCL